MAVSLPTAPLTFDIESSDEVALVRLHGRLVFRSGDTLHAEVKKLIPSHKRIVLDLSDLTHMDSSGLGIIAGLYVSARAAKCSLGLINLSHGIERILSLANLLSIFTVVGEQGIKIG